MFEYRYENDDGDHDVTTWPDVASVVSDYWANYTANAGYELDAEPLRDVTDAEEAAPELVLELSELGDPRALPLLIALAEAAPDRDSLFFLGAGPLEELFRAHGEALARSLVEAANRSNRFKIALSGVWPSPWAPLPERTMAILTPYLGADETTPFD